MHKFRLGIYSIIYAIAVSVAGCGLFQTRTEYIERIVYKPIDIPITLLVAGKLPTPPTVETYSSHSCTDKENDLSVYIKSILSYAEESDNKIAQIKVIIDQSVKAIEDSNNKKK